MGIEEMLKDIAKRKYDYKSSNYSSLTEDLKKMLWDEACNEAIFSMTTMLSNSTLDYDE